MRLFYLGSSLPIIWLVAFYVFILRARIVSGAWPSYDEGPNPASYGFRIHQAVLRGGMLILPLFFLVWCLLTTPASVSSRRFGLLLSLWLLPVALAIVDPGRFIRWFIFYGD